MTYYKVLDFGGKPFHGGTGFYFLPQGNRPGKWMPHIEKIKPCEAGYHVCNREHLIKWLGPEIWQVEIRGKVVDCGNKLVCQQARLIKCLDTWNSVTAKLFACDCAERSLSIFEKQYPTDNRPRNAIEVARRAIRGKVTSEELRAASEGVWHAARASASARAAVGAVTMAAATEIAWKKANGFVAPREVARVAAMEVAWDAARNADGVAVRNAVRNAARVAERGWQTNQLFDYLEGRIS